MKKGKAKEFLPKLKKDIKDFCLKEEGTIEKEKVVKIGLALAMMAVAFEQKAFAAQYDVTVHQNYFYGPGDPTATGGGHHSGMTGHASHSSHGSHGQW